MNGFVEFLLGLCIGGFLWNALKLMQIRKQ
jgi:hypothetical protein